jgi:hypothetical protein
MCLTSERRASVIAQRPDWKDLDDKALDDALAADYLQTTPAIEAATAKRAADAEEITSLSAALADRDAKILELSAAVKEKDAKVLELSAGAAGTPAKDIDPMALALINRSFKTDRQAVVASGVVSEAGMKEIDALLGVGGPRAVALSLSAGGTDPLYSRLCDIIRRNPGVRTDAGVKRDGLSTAAPPQFPALDLSGAAQQKQGGPPVSPERMAELLNLTPTGRTILQDAATAAAANRR